MIEWSNIEWLIDWVIEWLTILDMCTTLTGSCHDISNETMYIMYCWYGNGKITR